MNKEAKKYFRYLWQSILFWTIAFTLFGFFRFFGIGNEDGIQVHPDFQKSLSPGSLLPVFAIAGSLMGIAFGIIEILFERFASKKMALGLRMFVKTTIYFMTMIIIATTTVGLVMRVFNIPLNNDRGWWHQDTTFWLAIIYVFLASMVFSFIRIANEKFGPGIFVKMLLGKYKNPKEEKRIFMFLDLKSSTTIAEELGHYKYSQLIQDCFYDINEIVPKFDAEIYQYVGDEVVLSWPYHKGLVNSNCIALYFEFQRRLEKRAKYYRRKYGALPEFKAGLHGGKLMVAEVGVVKKELAFHGDVINTSARIQAECTSLNASILVSESLMNDLNIESKYITTPIGSVLLKGKKHEIDIFTIQQT